MHYLIKINKVKQSGIKNVDFENLPLGRVFTDHMFICEYHEGEWQNPRIQPLEAQPTHPAAMSLHYGQAIFEGMKVMPDENGNPLLFRPLENARRLNNSARRLGMPEFPEDLFIQGLKELVKIEKDWVPKSEGSSLYIRPFMYADEPFIGMRAASSYKFIIFASPSGKFYNKPIKLFAETKYIRAANGGTGETKAAGNYAAAISPTEIAKSKGYDQILWLDAVNFEYVQEVGTMNIFFKIGDTILTPNLGGAVLAGVTRASLIQILKDEGYKVEERPISIHEIIEAEKNGTLLEAFGCGTYVGIAMVEEIAYKDKHIKLPEQYPLATFLNKKLNDIRTLHVPDKYGWIVEVE
jgi:branched-chain amino acid aminotransferase